jgi:hypothetical protein
MSSPIFTVEESEFTIDGEKYDVSQVHLSSALNGIPVCSVGMYLGGSNSDNSTNVIPLSLAELQDKYKKLQEKAIKLASCNFKIILVSSDLDSDFNTSLDLKNWLLISVGMTPISTTAGFNINCTIVHPAYRLSLFLGTISIGTGMLDFNDKVEDVADPIKASELALDTCIEANEDQPEQYMPDINDITKASLKTLDEIESQIKESLNTVKENIKLLLKWDTSYTDAQSSILGEAQLPAFTDGIKYALLTTWTYSLFNQSYWDVLVGIISPEFGLEVIPTYDQETLSVGPAFPWKDTDQSHIDLPESMCENISFPGKDPDPLFGYIAQSDGEIPAGGLITLSEASTKKTISLPSQYAFIPSKPISSVGRIRKVQLPNWLSIAREYTARGKNSKGSITVGQGYDNKQSQMQASGSSGADELLKEIATGIMLHLSNLFTLEYKSGVQAVIQCPFFTGIKDNTLYAGKRIKLLTEDGKHLFTGSICAVNHSIDCSSSTATTNISLSHCVFSDADSEVLGKPPFAPYYSIDGVVVW